MEEKIPITTKSTSKQKTKTLIEEEKLRPEKPKTIKQILEVYQINQETDENSTNIKLEEGEEENKYLYNQIHEINYNRDYENPTGTGKIKLKYNTEDLKKIYKGKKVQIKTGREREKENIKLDEKIQEKEKKLTEEYEKIKQKLTEEDKEKIKKQAKEDAISEITGLEPAILGWITEEKISPEELELTINDYGKLLEEKNQLEYENMYRSQILEEIIKLAGLEPIIDFTNLQNDIISWKSTNTNTTEENTEKSTKFTDCTPILDMTNKLNCKVSKYGEIPKNITKEMYAKIGKNTANYAKEMKGKTAKEVWQACKNGLKYCKYQCTRDKCASTSWSNKSNPGLNCGDSARLLKCCMDVAGIKCIMIHTPGHFYNAVEVNGKWLTADLCYVNNSRGTNQLMGGK